MPIRLQLLSDLHLESPKSYDLYTIPPSAPYLALLGDIGQAGAPSHRADFRAFVKRHLRSFRAVLLVPGNHEAYHSTWPETLTVLRALADDVRERRARGESGLGEFVLLERGAWIAPDDAADGPAGWTVFLGCSLFSRVPPASEAAVEMGMNDFFHTGAEWTVAAHNAAHARDVAWLNGEVVRLQRDESVQSIVVLTHWSPSTAEKALDPRHKDSAIRSAFSTDLSDQDCWKAEKVKVWACGHTHFNFDFKAVRGEGRSRLRAVSNQRGYYFQQAQNFDEGKVLDI